MEPSPNQPEPAQQIIRKERRVVSQRKEEEERQAQKRYQNALAKGLSDHEAREEGWPTPSPPGVLNSF